MALSAVDDDALQAELFGDAHPGGNVVGPVGVDVDGQLPPHHGQQRLQLGVKLGALLVLVLLRPVQLLAVLQGLGQILPDDGRRGHTGDGGLVPLVIHALGVLSQGHLHGRRGLDDHLVHPPSGGLDGGELAAHRVGGAGAGEHRGHAPLPCLLKAAVLGIDGVDGPQVRGAGVGGLVAVVPLKTHCVPEHPQVAVGVDKAGQHMVPPGVHRLPLPLCGAVLHGPHPGDLPPGHGNKAPGNGLSVHGVDDTVDDKHDRSPSCIVVNHVAAWRADTEVRPYRRPT